MDAGDNGDNRNRNTIKEGERDEKETGFEIHRLKGLIYLEDGSRRIIQGVRDLFEIITLDDQDEGKTKGKIVVIGRDLLSPSSNTTATRGQGTWQESLSQFLIDHQL